MGKLFVLVDDNAVPILTFFLPLFSLPLFFLFPAVLCCAPTEKHKSFHIKDEQLTRDGFKKFTKHEACLFDDCRFSRVCNHIHCIRTG